MIVRSIFKDEINEYCCLGNQELECDRLKGFILDAWENKTSAPDLCFVVEDNNQFIASIFIGSFSQFSKDLALFRLYVNPKYNYFDVAKMLLEDVLISLKEKEINSLEYHVYSKDCTDLDDKMLLFTGLGFNVIQEKLQYIYNKKNMEPFDEKLDYRSLKEVGEDSFILAIRLVTRNTLDRVDNEDVKRLGTNDAAKNYYNCLKEIDYNEERWLLAFNKLGELTGLVVPQKFDDTTGAINYIGVVPEKRGFGYSRELLNKGVSILLNEGCEEVIADIDINNYPLKQALESIDFNLNKKELVLKIEF